MKSLEAYQELVKLAANKKESIWATCGHAKGYLDTTDQHKRQFTVYADGLAAISTAGYEDAIEKWLAARHQKRCDSVLKLREELAALEGEAA